MNVPPEHVRLWTNTARRGDFDSARSTGPESRASVIIEPDPEEGN